MFLSRFLTYTRLISRCVFLIVSHSVSTLFRIHTPSTTFLEARTSKSPSTTPLLYSVATRLAGEGFGFTVAAHPLRYLASSFGAVPVTPDNPLGFRPSNYVPTDTDYRHYVSQREKLLQSPRGYAALMAGGLASRMARDFVAPELFYAKLSSDPNPTFFHPLTTSELDLIYGIYRQETGQVSLSGKRQFIHKSWWPPHKIWTSSMLGLTFWTTDAEA
ncbi:hypothetical protein PTI98_012761 [Pleurotus ostreatus]|nr:hypothetical protein PTI98_012761 [Pleurotus ostreatus]